LNISRLRGGFVSLPPVDRVIGWAGSRQADARGALSVELGKGFGDFTGTLFCFLKFIAAQILSPQPGLINFDAEVKGIPSRL